MVPLANDPPGRLDSRGSRGSLGSRASTSRPGGADLHTHSNVSDGTEPPGVVVAQAARAGLRVLALTDHDTAGGWAEASASAEEHGITLVRGMEMSARLPREEAPQGSSVSVHLLSYLHEPSTPALQAALERARESRRTRARRIVDRLAEDFPVSWQDVLAHVGDDATVGRPHIADALVAAGVVVDRGEAFARLLHAGTPYYASYWSPTPVEAVRLVVEAGGVPVLAHPFANTRGPSLDDDAVAAMVEAGLRGIEVDHRDQDRTERAHARALAERHGLLMTGSSDYHGEGKPNRLGEHTTPLAVVRRIAELGRLPLVCDTLPS